MFKITGVWGRAICITCKIFIDIIKEQITDENIRKERSRYRPLCAPDSTLLYSLSEELILILWIRLDE